MSNLKMIAKIRLSQIQRRTAKLFSAAVLLSALAYSQTAGQVLTGYFPEWGPSSGFTPNSLDPYVVSRLNYLIYAFATINGNSCQLTDATSEPTTFQQLKALKANNSNLKVLLSIGGQNSDGPLQAATANGNASSFASSCIFNFFTTYPGVFDGVDIDWEYPTSADTASFTALVQAFHTQLGSGAIVTAAIGVTPAQYGNIQFSTVSKYINYFSVMGYDVAADTVTTFNAPLYNSFISGGQDTWNGTVDAAVTDLTKTTGSYKVPPGQLLLGVPFYGMKWTGVPDGTFPDGTSSNGFYQSASAATQVPYSTIVTMSGTKHCDFAGTENQSCTAPSGLPTSGSQETWLYDGSNLTSFDDPISMATKVQYARAKKMGGITVWELSQDQSQDKKHELLMDSIVTGMGGTPQGNWIGAYGADGYFIANESPVLPTYASVCLTGDATYTWAPSTSDVRALQTSGGSSRIASAYYSSTGFSINVNITDGNIHRVALYLLNWDSNARSETISIVNAATNAVLDTQTFSSFHNGEYAAWNLQGQVRIQVTNDGGPNAVVSGIFFGPGSPSASAMFTGPDAATKGNWTGAYGTHGEMIAGEPSAAPGFASVSLTGDGAYTWTASTTDVRALQISSGSSTRIASAYYSATQFTINLNLTDGNTHRIALYLLDWDSNPRNDTISIVDAATNTLLDLETFSNFHNGEYAVWNIRGHVLIQVTNESGANAVVSGIFFD